MIKFFLKNGSCLFALLAIATLAGNGGWLVRTIRGIDLLRSSWGERAYRGNGDHVDLPRQMVERHVSPGTSVYMVNIKSNELMSVERSRHLAVSWAMSPTPVRFGYDPGIGDAQAVLGCAYGPGPEFSSAGLDSAEFKKVDEGGGSALWMRTGACPPSSTTLCARSPTPAAWREVAGLLAPVSVAVGGAVAAGWSGALLGVFLFSLGLFIPPLAGFRPSPEFVVAVSGLCLAIVGMLRSRLLYPQGDPHPTKACKTAAGLCCFGLLLVMIVMTLSHTFMAPNGLGVNGGKAKLLYLAHGIPEGFFTDPACGTLQPAYPPGFALLTLGCYGLAGGCGEWMTQILGCFCLAAVFLFLCRRAQSCWASIWVLTAFLGSPALPMATLFYAEPLMTLFILVGWERIRNSQNDLAGWVLIGTSGWFKNEGLVFLLVIWMSFRLVSGSRAASCCHLLAGLAIPVTWQLFVRMFGAELYDYAPFWNPDASKVWEASLYLLKTAFAEPWRYGFAYPLMAVALMFQSYRRCPSIKTSVLVAVFCSLAFVGVYSLSTAPDFGWHLHSSLGRLLWVPSLLIVYEVLKFFEVSKTRDFVSSSLT